MRLISAQSVAALLLAACSQADDLTIASGTSATSGDFESAPGRFRATPFEFDPGGTGIVAAGWIRHLGLPDAFGSGRYGLLLSKNGPTATNASAGVTLSGVSGLVLADLG